MAVTLAYVGLYLARVAIELVYFPWMLSLSAPPAGSSTSELAVVLLSTTDALLSLGTGLLFGNSIEVYLQHRKLVLDPTTASRPYLP